MTCFFFVGDFLRIRSHGIYHNFAPPVGEYLICLYIFVPTALSKAIFLFQPFGTVDVTI